MKKYFLEIKKIIKILTQDCWICGAPTFLNFELCDHCKYLISKKTGRIISNTQLPFTTRALWEWSSNKNSWCREFIYKLKNKPHMPLHDWLIENWLVEGNTSKRKTNYFNKKRGKNNNKTWIVVPSPRDLNEKHDHAYSLAKALASHLNISLQDILLRESRGQRQKSREQRSKITIRVKERSVLKAKNKIIFVDDVLTTGSTAQAAWLALGKPKDFEAWTLIYRSYSSTSKSKNSGKL